MSQNRNNRSRAKRERRLFSFIFIPTWIKHKYHRLYQSINRKEWGKSSRNFRMMIFNRGVAVTVRRDRLRSTWRRHIIAFVVCKLVKLKGIGLWVSYRVISCRMDLIWSGNIKRNRWWRFGMSFFMFVFTMERSVIKMAQ